MGLINDFLGSVRILSTTIDEWMEEELKETTKEQGDAFPASGFEARGQDQRSAHR